MWSSQAYIGRNSRLYKGGVLKHSLEGLLACLNVESSSAILEVLIGRSSWVLLGRSCFKCGVLKHTLGRSSCLFKCGVLKHTLEGLLACINVEFSSIHWKVFLLV